MAGDTHLENNNRKKEKKPGGSVKAWSLSSTELSARQQERYTDVITQ